MSRRVPTLGSPLMRMARPVQIVCLVLFIPLTCVSALLGWRLMDAPSVVFGILFVAAAIAILVTVFTWLDGGIARELGPGELAALKSDIAGEPDLVVAVGKYLAAGSALLTTEAASLRLEVACRRDERARTAVAAEAKAGDGQAMEFFTGAYASSRSGLPEDSK